MSCAERAISATFREIGGFTEINFTLLAFSHGTGTTMLSRSTIRYSQSLGCRGTLADDELTFCVTVVDGSESSMLRVATSALSALLRVDLCHAAGGSSLPAHPQRAEIREILGGSLGVLDDFPAKPKGMHWRRYNRLRHLHDQAVEESLATLQGHLSRLGGQLSRFR